MLLFVDSMILGVSTIMMFPSPFSHSSILTLAGVTSPQRPPNHALYFDRIFRFVVVSGPVGMMEKMIDDLMME
jgi:hypothetical protein